MKTNKGEKYHTRPYVLWALLSTAIVVVSLVGAIYEATQGASLSGVIANRGLTGGACILLSFSLSVAVSWLFPVLISKQGIRSYTALGLYRSVEWTQIDRIEAVSVAGIRYGRIYTKAGGSSIWIPGFMANRDRFVAQLRQHTPHSSAFEAAFVGDSDSVSVGARRPVGAGS